VSNLTGATAIAASSIDVCALLSGGNVACWGDNTSGQLGNATTAGNAPTPVQMPNVSGVTAIAVGDYHICALLSGGTVECWGNNASGQLGNGTTTNSPTPVSVSNLTGAKALTAGPSDTCALRSDGTVACWGYNFHGQLGNGTTINALMPVTVSE
jgi:alpha-tubulin suppressor-like RCC1 family protein